MTTRLSRLIPDLPDALGTVPISAITDDSRQVSKGALFVAVPGAKVDGRDFIPAAVEAGAAAILAPEGTRPVGDVPVIARDPVRQVFAHAAAAWFGGTQPAHVAAVTGTNGKSSTVSFARQMWAADDLAAASMGTLGIDTPTRHIAGSLTTPGVLDLHRRLAEITTDDHVTHLAFEASSHGLDQHRQAGVRVDPAVMTNLTRDHLDYHGTPEAYRAAKFRLFEDVVSTDGAAVINADDPTADALTAIAERRGLRLIRYGTAGQEIRLLSRDIEQAGQRLHFAMGNTTAMVDLPLIGAFQAMNVLAALGIVMASGASVESAVDAMPHLLGVPGRLELVARTAVGAPVLVDYAHTPDALETVLKAIRPHCAGRLIVVFGCGGDRDRGKRPLMGRIGVTLADHAIVTDDNPRSEDPATIRREILAAAEGAQEIGDRSEAIRAAVGAAGPEDVILIAGKGHEAGQIVGSTVLPFDDAEEARFAVQEVGA